MKKGKKKKEFGKMWAIDLQMTLFRKT